MSKKSTAYRWTLTIALSVLLIVALVVSLFIGASTHSPQSIIQAFHDRNWDAPALTTVTYIRLPRGILALVIGAALAVSGAIMQLVTRNPLASPQTLGINATAALAMVAYIVLGWNIGSGVWPAFFGACLGGFAVMLFSLGSRRGPVVLALAGMAVHLLCTALIQALAVLNERAVDVVFWMNGSLAGAQWDKVRLAVPLVTAMLLLAIACSRSIQALGLGREIVTGLGIPYLRTISGATILVTILAGTSVAAAGPIGFVGLIVPHVVRALIGRAPMWEFPLCALVGAILLVLADIGARIIMWPSETPVGVLTALIGAPVFLFLARAVGRKK
ncbi:FecCD family ABC transporter permease [Corynebacterium kutscheri]|uniref:FecCD family ABC transporter permease n=1 Tax=Corynebacterium kutscheri TaxID=35755 RepID=UPI0037BFA734